MSHSLYHAKSSQKKFGNDHTNYTIFLPVHNWFDASKAITCNFRHRALRHHTQGIALAKQIFGEVKIWGEERMACVVTDTISIDNLGKQHLEEDFKSCPDASQWYELFEIESWMKRKADNDLLLRLCAKKFGGEPDDYQILLDFFTQFDTDDLRSRMILWHSFGIFTAEEALGVTFKRQSDDKDMPTRTVAETIINTNYNFIPTPLDWIKSMREEKWMHANASALSKNYD